MDGKIVTIVPDADEFTICLSNLSNKKTYPVTPNVKNKIILPDTLNNLSYLIRSYNTGSKCSYIDVTNLDLKNTFRSLYYTFSNSALQEIVFPKDYIIKPTNIYAAFSSAPLTDLDLSNFDFSEILASIDASFTFMNCTKLKNLAFGTNLKVSLSFSQSPLTLESAISVLQGLAEVDTVQTVTFKATTYNELMSTDNSEYLELIDDVINNKGWTIASA